MRTHNKAERQVQKTILNLNLMIKIRRAGALASLALRFGAIIIVTAVMIVTAITGASAQAAAPAAVATIAPDAARDSATKVFLQKHFKIPDPDMIVLGPVVRTPIAGLLGRQVTISFGVGQKASSALFFDKNGTKMIIGTFVDTS